MKILTLMYIGLNKFRIREEEHTAGQFMVDKNVSTIDC